MLLAIASIGAAGWIWTVVSSLSANDGPERTTEALDVLASQATALLVVAIAAGIGIGLRVVATPAPSRRATPIFARPFAAMLLVGTFAAAVAIVASTALDRQSDTAALDDETVITLQDLFEDPRRGIDVPPVRVQGANQPPSERFTLEVHDDNCGVLRSGQLGDNVSWVFKDPDGFVVLERRASSELRYRFFGTGTFTAVLTAWGGNRYYDVSNEVTVRC